MGAAGFFCKPENQEKKKNPHCEPYIFVQKPQKNRWSDQRLKDCEEGEITSSCVSSF